jgi:hypothetical protein
VSTLINRKEEIKKKGFSMTDGVKEDLVYDASQNSFVPVDFSKIKVGTKTLEDAILNLGNYRRADNRFVNRDNIFKAMQNRDYEEMRAISNFYFDSSGIYARLCRYMAKMYRYD